jgi:predicted site-specific integrase-resolvase
MNFERYNLSQLSRITKTNPRTLYEWIRKGYLKPCHIAGTRKKYSIQNFLDAEKSSLQEKSKIVNNNHRTNKIPDEFFDNL